jgi:dephospho-CoA kinase
VIGVAGGIGAGKTLVARQLEQLGAVVVDADGTPAKRSVSSKSATSCKES